MNFILVKLTSVWTLNLLAGRHTPNIFNSNGCWTLLRIYTCCLTLILVLGAENANDRTWIIG